MAAAGSLARGLLGLLITVIGVIVVIYGVFSLISGALLGGVVEVIIGAILIWVGTGPIGLPSRLSSSSSS
jgi:hypothetical protein